jgi:hypothetical protein
MYIVKKVSDEVIIVVTAVGPYNGESLHKMSGQVATLTDSISGRVYRINDLTHSRIGFMELIDALAYDVQGKAGTVSDPRVVNLTVARDPIQQIGIQVVDLMLGRRRSPIFQSVRDALDYARREIGARPARNVARLN